METSEAMYAAADIIEARGWYQRGGHFDMNGTCASNALAEVTGRANETLLMRMQYAFAAHIGGTGPTDIFTWNDAPHRTAEQVVKELRAAAVIEAAKEDADRDTDTRCRPCYGSGTRLHGWAICPGPCRDCDGTGVATNTAALATKPTTRETEGAL